MRHSLWLQRLIRKGTQGHKSDTSEGGWKSQLLFKFLCTQFKSHLLTLCCGGSQRAMSKQLNRKRKKKSNFQTWEVPGFRNSSTSLLQLVVTSFYPLAQITAKVYSFVVETARGSLTSHTLAWNSGVQQCGNKQDSSSHTCLTTLSPWEPFYISSTPHCAGSVPPPPPFLPWFITLQRLW